MTDLPPISASTPPQPPVAAPKSGKGLRIAFAVSVALNLAVIGVVAGAILRGGPHGGRFVRELDFGPYAEAFSPADRAALRDRFFERDGSFRAMRDQMRAEGAALIAVLRADTLDLQRLSDLMAAQQDGMAQRIALGRELVVERIAAMSAADRKAFANRLEQAFQHGPDGGDRQGKDKRSPD